jgi:hypothetical protein
MGGMYVCVCIYMYTCICMCMCVCDAKNSKEPLLLKNHAVYNVQAHRSEHHTYSVRKSYAALGGYAQIWNNVRRNRRPCAS